MNYINRSIENHIIHAEKNFKSILVTGARQTGKSTLLKHLAPKRKYVTFDDPFIEEQAKNSPEMFMALNQPPIIFDEVQRVPGLFRYIKMECDSRSEYGLYDLSGSQPFRLMQSVSESLAGRVCIVELAPLSLREIQGDTCSTPFLPTMDHILRHQETARKPENIWKIIHRGGYPELYQNPELDWQQFYASYVKTYLERDVRELSSVQDLDAFRRFMVAAAARTGQMLNYSNIADEIGKEVEVEGEIDIIIEENGVLYPVEIKKNTSEKAIATSAFQVLDQVEEKKRGMGAVISLCPQPGILRENILEIPVWYV